jgi:hypothetical protein
VAITDKPHLCQQKLLERYPFPTCTATAAQSQYGSPRKIDSKAGDASLSRKSLKKMKIITTHIETKESSVYVFSALKLNGLLFLLTGLAEKSAIRANQI